MALINRITRLFHADLHAVLDRLEEPETLLRQAIREMEAAQDADEQRIQVLRLELDRIDKQRADLAQSLATIAEELDSCFAAEAEDLAKSLIRRRLETERFDALVARKQGSLAEELSLLAKRVRENRTRLESMRQKADILARETPPTVDPYTGASGDPAVQDADVEVAYLREKQKRSSQ
ncbi:MAG: PspA/IM30 family protein [Magnetospiraceae bacterium]